MKSSETSLSGQKILVWDAPVRVFHALLALSIAGAWLTAETDGWRLVHVTFGYTVAALVLLRVLWGLMGTRYARFSDFVRGPLTVARYLRDLLQSKATEPVGHNPAGAVVIVGFLILGLLVPLSGWATLNERGGESLEEIHEWLAQAMLVLVGVHVAGVLIASHLHRAPLVRAMVTGYKRGNAGQAIRRTWWSVASALLLAVGTFWALQWQAAEQGGWIQAQRVLAASQEDGDSGREGSEREDD